jgi:hypothetical protein
MRLPRTRLEWVERLAGAGMWIAIGVSVCLLAARLEWTWVSSACIVALALVSAVAGIPRRRAGRRLVLRKASADEPVHGHRTFAVVSRLMPASAGPRWLAEAESVLAEVPPARRAAAVRSYLRSAPRLAVTMWAREVLRWARRGPRLPG